MYRLLFFTYICLSIVYFLLPDLLRAYAPRCPRERPWWRQRLERTATGTRHLKPNAESVKSRRHQEERRHTAGMLTPSRLSLHLWVYTPRSISATTRGVTCDLATLVEQPINNTSRWKIVSFSCTVTRHGRLLARSLFEAIVDDSVLPSKMRCPVSTWRLSSCFGK